MLQNNYKIQMYHYACRTWRNAQRGAWMPYGHSHGRLLPFGKSMDVGTMLHGYAPLSFAEVEERMNAKATECPDHDLITGPVSSQDSSTTLTG